MWLTRRDMSVPRAIFLDLDSLRPQDISLECLQALPVSWSFYSHTSPGEVVERLADADIVVCNKVVIDQRVIDACPRLQLVAVTATGTNNIDREAAAKRGIAVRNVQAYGTTAVAQHTLALLLALCNRLQDYAAAACDGRWSRSQQFCLLEFPMTDLSGKTMGIIGYGELGQAVARLARAFGMDVLVAEGQQGIAPGRLPLEQVLAAADVVSLHCLLSPATEKLVNARTLGQMKAGALLINTARGGLVDESALLQALESGHLGGAALDVLAQEPPPPDHLLLRAALPNLLITPHCAWGSPGARQRLLAMTADNIAGFLDQRTGAS